MMASSKWWAGFRSCVVATLALLSLSFQANAQSLSFANLPGTSVNFIGGTFTFSSNTNGYQFNVTQFDGGNGPSVGLQGYLINTDLFTIGTITNFNTPFGPVQMAPVFGSATLHITDANSVDLTGSIHWINITTIGTGGDLDLQGSVNLTGITYGGANSDLSTLAAAGSASDVVTFQFNPAQTLMQLAAATSVQTASYSGVIVVPEPSTWVLVAMGIGFGIFLRGRKLVRS